MFHTLREIGVYVGKRAFFYEKRTKEEGILSDDCATSLIKFQRFNLRPQLALLGLTSRAIVPELSYAFTYFSSGRKCSPKNSKPYESLAFAMCVKAPSSAFILSPNLPAPT